MNSDANTGRIKQARQEKSIESERIHPSHRTAGMHILLGVLVLTVVTACSGRPASAAEQWSLPEGTELVLRLNDHLSTKVNKVGDPFTARVLEDVFEGEQLIVPRDSVVTGSVSRVLRPGRFRGRAIMNLMFDTIRIPRKGEFPFMAVLLDIHAGKKSRVKPEGSIEASASKKGDAGKIARPGAIGAGIGALAGGRRGAGIGAGIGAAVGLINVLGSRGHDLEVKRGSILDVALERPLTVPAKAAAAP